MKNNEEKELGLNEISRLSNINKSTVYKILQTLITKDIVGQNKESKKYFLSYGLLELSNKVLKERSLHELFHPIIKKLAKATEKTITLGLRHDNDLVFIDRIDGNESANLNCEIGKRMSFYEGAASKALFASLPDEEILELQRNKLRNNIENNKEIAEFFSQINNIRKLGYSISDEEIDSGVFAIGAPVFDHNGNVVAGIAIATIKSSLTVNGKEMLINELLDHTFQISKKLGYDGVKKFSEKAFNLKY